MKNRLNQGLEPSLYFFRDNNQNEVDLLFKSGNNLIPIEIKSSRTFNTEFLKGLKYFRTVTEARCPFGFLIYAGDQEQRIDIFQVVNYKNVKTILKTMQL